VNPTTYVVNKVVKNNVGSFCEVLYGKHKQCSEIKVTAMAKKKRKATFVKEWRLITGQDAPPLPKQDTLHQLCIDNNIEYLYNDLLKSRNMEAFQMNSDLIQQMLNRPKPEKSTITVHHGIR
jgi:hypothetical protein